MKFHAYRSLLTATAGVALALGAISVSAKDSFGTERMELQNQAAADYGTRFRSASIKALFSGDTTFRGGGVCGDSSPDEGEDCDDGNTVNGDGCSATCTFEAGFDCTAAIPGSSTENILVNGSFEDSIAGWTAFNDAFGSGLFCDDGCFGFPFAAAPDGTTTSGTYVLIAGGTFAAPSTGTLDRDPIFVPANATTLEFQWATLASGPAGDPCAGSTDGIRLDLNGTEVFASTEPCTNVNPYQRVVVDLATAPGGPYTNTNVTIGFRASATGIPPDTDLTNVFVDDISINVPVTPVIPPTPSSCSAVVCGDGLFPQFSAAGTEGCDDGNLADGDGCSSSCEVEQPNFVCDDPDAPAANGEDLDDGSLEDGRANPFWTASNPDPDNPNGTVFNPICSQIFCGAALADTGAFYAWFGGASEPNMQTLAQDVVISSTATTIDFSLLVGICDSANDTLTIDVDGTAVYSFNCLDDFPVYTAQSADISAFADGGLHTITFTGNTLSQNGGNSNMFVDDISISDNVPFAGEPSQCFELAAALNTPEQFEAGIPGDWTVINVGAVAADGWGTSDDGICASANWSGGNAQNNVTGGGGASACADSDATGQVDVDAGGDPQEMETFLCSPELDLTTVPVGRIPTYSFLVNYQSADNDLNDNGTPDDANDDFDDEFLQVLVGTQPPNALTVPNYENLGNVFDHLDTNLAFSEEAALAADISEAAAGSDTAHVCFHYRGTFSWFAQIDNAALRTAADVSNSDGDTIPDNIDNCTLTDNENQVDTDGDGYGNACDADFNNDCIVNFPDLGIFRTLFFQPNNQADLDGNGITNFVDLGIFRQLFFAAPGPSEVGTLGCGA